MNTKNTNTSITTEAELPIDGDATAQMNNDTTTTGSGATVPAVDPRMLFSKDYMKGYSKPLWWYPLMMPFWVSIALKGSNGLNERLTVLEGNHRPHQISPVNSPTNNNNGDYNNPTATTTETNGTTSAATAGVGVDASSQQQQQIDAATTITTTAVIVEPSVVDYGYAIFFIIFGSIALVAGVASNVYVQMHDIFM